LLFFERKELFAKLLQKNSEFAQFFLAVALKKTVVTTAQLLQCTALPGIFMIRIFQPTRMEITGL